LLSFYLQASAGMRAAAKKRIVDICLHSHSQMFIILSESYQGSYGAALPFWVQQFLRWHKTHHCCTRCHSPCWRFLPQRALLRVCSEESPVPCRQPFAQGTWITRGQNSGGL